MATAAPTFSAGGTPSFCGPAKLRILLAPAGPIEQAEFERWASFVRGITRVRMRDIPRATGSLPPTSPLMQFGEVHVQCVTSYDPGHAFLAPFSVHTQALGVLGIISYHKGTPYSKELERVPGLLRAQHPGALVHRVFGIEVPHTAPDGDGDLGGATEEPDGDFAPNAGFAGRKESGLVIFPALRRDAKDVKFYMRTLVAEFIGAVLDSLESLISSLDGAPLETPRDTLGGLAATLASVTRAPPLPARPETAQSSVAKVFGSRIIGRRDSGGAEKPSSGPTSPTRYNKVRADVALLSGDLWTAIEIYDSLLTHTGRERALAGGQDAVWFASALEGWAVTRTLLARLGGAAVDQAPRIAYPFMPGRDRDRDRDVRDSVPAPLVWKDVVEAYSLALTIYAKCLAPPHLLATPVSSVTNETPRDYTHPLVHAGACLAFARFLHAVWASSGWNGECFDQLLAGGVPPALGGGALTPSEYAQLSALSGVYRHEVAIAVDAAVTQSLRVLSAADQLAVLGEAATILAQLGFARRHSHVISLLHVVLSRVLAASQWKRSTDSVALNIPARVEPSGTASAAPALMLGLQAADTYGVDLLASPVRGLPPTHPLTKTLQRIIKARYAPLVEGDADKEIAQLSCADPRLSDAGFGWPELQVRLVKSLAALAEALSDHVAMAFFGALLLRNYAHALTGAEQAALIEGLHKVLPRARATAPKLELAYYGPAALLAALEVRPLPDDRVPQARGKSEFQSALRARRVAQNALVQDEPVTVDVTLRNPLEIELLIARIELCASGVPFDAAYTSTVVPPRSLQTVSLHGVPRSEGQLGIEGIIVTLWGAEQHSLRLACHIDGERVHVRDVEHPVGLDARPALRAVARGASATPPQPLVCTVYPAQPTLQVYFPELVHPTVSVADGVTMRLNMRLNNPSDTPADLVSISLDDSLQGPMHDAVSSGNLLPSDVHEIEWRLLNHPVLAHDSGSVSVPPRSSAVVPLRVTGRLGCTWARVTVRYAHDTGAARVLTKTAQRTIALTVRPGVSCVSASVLAPSTAAAQRLGAPGKALAFVFENGAAVPRKVRVEGGTTEHEISVGPNSSARLVAPFAPFALSDEQLARDVPVLLPKQYVVPKMRLSAEAKAEHLRQFWVRDTLLALLRASWSDDVARGDISLREFWPSPAECDLMLVPRISVALSVERATVEWPTVVTAAVTNDSDAPVSLVCTWSLVEPAGRVLVTDGTWTTRVMPWPLAPHSRTHVPKTLCFLARGRFSLQASVAHADGHATFTSEPLSIVVTPT